MKIHFWIHGRHENAYDVTHLGTARWLHNWMPIPVSCDSPLCGGMSGLSRTEQNASATGFFVMRNVAVTLNSDNQIEVRVGSELRFGESYYLGLQPNRVHDDFRPASGTLQLVTEWIRWLSSLDDGQQIFLPFDFSDEFTRWIHVDRTGRDLTIVFGWATIEGWAISASDLSEYIHGLPGFMPDEPLYTQTLYLPRVIADLRCSQQHLRQRASLESLHATTDNHLKT